MADNVAITAGSGTTVATDDIGGGVQVQRVKATWGPDGTANDTDVATGKPMPVQLRSSTGVDFVKAEDAAGADGDFGIPMLARRTDTTAASSGTDGDYEVPQIKGGRLVVRGEPKFYSAVFGTITRTADTNVYAANDALSNSVTAGSVTSQTASVSDVNDDPFTIERIRLTTTDTGVTTKSIRAWLFSVDPTASSGITGADNAAFSIKKTASGFLGCMSGVGRTCSDGSNFVLVPDEGARIVAKPVSGAMTVYILLQTLEVFTPVSASTWIATAEGFQGRA